MKNQQLTRENYYDFGSSSNPVFSSSSLKYIYPHDGGSPVKLKLFLSGDAERKESKSMSNGTIVHQYLENPNGFKVYPEKIPSEAIMKIIDEVYATLTLSGRTPVELTDDIALIVHTCRRMNYGADNWSTETLLKKVVDDGKGINYFKFLIEASDCVIMSEDTKKILTGIANTFETNEDLREFLHKQSTESYQIFREVPIQFEIDGFMCKALLDRIELDHVNKVAVVYDYKTTSGSINQYSGYVSRDAEGNQLMVPGQFQKYKVYRQLAFYGLAAGQLIQDLGFNLAEWTIAHYVIPCETNTPNEVMFRFVPTQWIAYGAQEIKECFEIIKSNYDKIVTPDEREY